MTASRPGLCHPRSNMQAMLEYASICSRLPLLIRPSAKDACSLKEVCKFTFKMCIHGPVASIAYFQTRVSVLLQVDLLPSLMLLAGLLQLFLDLDLIPHLCLHGS